LGDLDAELLELIAEYQRREERADERGIDDAERARRCDRATEVRDRIEKIRPTTLCGVLAVLDCGSEIAGDPDYWPDEAIEGLRDHRSGASRRCHSLGEGTVMSAEMIHFPISRVVEQRYFYGSYAGSDDDPDIDSLRAAQRSATAAIV